jgi:hypothetical protein
MSLPGLPGLDRRAARELLRTGTLEVQGRLVVSSNAALYCTLRASGHELPTIYKPIRFERPLWDFPDGTLANREVAAALVSDASGWGIVPPTVLRDGPFGPGMVQLWIETDPAVHSWDLVRTSDRRLRRMALFDAVVNNTDRKGGHILPVCLEPGLAGVSASQGPLSPAADDDSVDDMAELAEEPVDHSARPLHLYGVDHGVCFSDDPKLRTVLWAWRGQPIEPAELAELAGLGGELQGRLGRRLARLLAPTEVAATNDRLASLLTERRFPLPDPELPAVPWPPY